GARRRDDRARRLRRGFGPRRGAVGRTLGGEGHATPDRAESGLADGTISRRSEGDSISGGAAGSREKQGHGSGGASSQSERYRGRDPAGPVYGGHGCVGQRQVDAGERYPVSRAGAGDL